ncbi:coiled-coil domain-containing protein 81-like isoform X2 [Engraulis encrasicolus]|uniref:coiled-coil domain-containing protein 81-like isoform X2 n=1 Tax=Engraulis encrasicolus TaxID=184585 RepID=UPI002FD34760
MTDILVSVVSEAKHAFPTLSKLSEGDVDNIWSDVSSFIERQMSLQKGVQIHGLGTFTFCQKKLDVGNKYILIQRPVFLLSEKLSLSHGIRQVKRVLVGDVPEVSLNFSALTAESLFDRDVIEGCVRETLILLLRAIATQRSVLFTFKGIGVLVFRNSKVKMHFSKDFLSSMDGGGGGRALSSLGNRPGSSSSLSLDKLSRPGSCSSTVQLPCIPPPTARQEVGPSRPAHSACDTARERGRETPSLTSLKGLTSTKSASLIEKLYTTPSKCHQKQTSLSEPLQPEHSALDELKVKKGRDVHFNLACKDHTRAGQELCYLCMQRKKRNIPLYVAEERWQEDQEEARLLMLGEEEKDQQYLKDTKVEQKRIQENNKKVAAFNLDVAEAMKRTRALRPSQFHPSYIFRVRQDTPNILLKQRNYMQNVMDQQSCNLQNQQLNKQSQELIGYLQQVQLSHEIAQQNSLMNVERYNSSEYYRKALDAQVEQEKPRVHFKKGIVLPPIIRPSGIVEMQEQTRDYQRPAIKGSDFVFGAFDNNPEALVQQRQMAQALYQDQLCTATQKKNEATLHQIVQRRKERKMLQTCQKELKEDRLSNYHKLCKLRKSLEGTWGCMANLKHQRDKEERNFIRCGSRLLISQCDQYHRCVQCQRKPENSGQSNILKETRYIAGSRLMV